MSDMETELSAEAAASRRRALATAAENMRRLASLPGITETERTESLWVLETVEAARFIGDPATQTAMLEAIVAYTEAAVAYLTAKYAPEAARGERIATEKTTK